MPGITNEHLPLTVREATETRLKNMPVKPEVKDALKPGKILKKGNLSGVAAENLVPAGKETLSFKIEKGETFNEKLSRSLYGKGYMELSNEQRYFVVTIETILIQEGANVNKLNAGANFYFNFNDGSCTDDKESHGLILVDFVSVTKKTLEKVDSEYSQLLKEGILYKAFMQDRLDSSFAGRAKFLKDNEATLLPLINQYLREKGQPELDTTKANLGYTGTEAQNGAYLRAYVDMKRGGVSAAPAAPTPAPVETAKPTTASETEPSRPATGPSSEPPLPPAVEAPTAEMLSDNPELAKEQMKRVLKLREDIQIDEKIKDKYRVTYRDTQMIIQPDFHTALVLKGGYKILQSDETVDALIDKDKGLTAPEAPKAAPQPSPAPVEELAPSFEPIPQAPAVEEFEPTAVPEEALPPVPAAPAPTGVESSDPFGLDEDDLSVPRDTAPAPVEKPAPVPQAPAPKTTEQVRDEAARPEHDPLAPDPNTKPIEEPTYNDPEFDKLLQDIDQKSKGEKEGKKEDTGIPSPEDFEDEE